MNNSVLFSIIVLILICIIYYNKCNTILPFQNPECYKTDNNINNNIIQDNLSKYLEGYWISDNNFLKISEIDNLILYIDIITNFGYLVIVKNKQIVHNIEFKTNYKKNTIIIDNDNNLNNIKFDISFNSKDPDFIWKDKVFNCILSINDGNLKLFEKNILYGNLFKENKVSYYLKNI
jgi:hypothetical protein